MKTENPDDINKLSKNNGIDFTLITINLKNNSNNNYIPKISNRVLNNYTFKEAIKYDQRDTVVIVYIFLLVKQIFFHTFLYRSPLELFSLRLCLFIFIISSDLSLNALFYFNDNISRKYRYSKNIFLFAFSDNLTIIIISIVVGFILLTFLAKLSNTTGNIREIFQKEEEKLKANKKYVISDERKKRIMSEIVDILNNYKKKVIILIIIELLLMLFFWYFVIAFCHVYHETQFSWLLDSLISIAIRSVIEIIISFGFAYLYRMAISGEIHCLYKLVMFLYNFG
jgi:hypothetical protein